MNGFRRMVSGGCSLALALGVWGAAFEPVQKQFIAHGWDLLGVSPEEVLAHAAAFDRTGVDGVTLMIDRTLPDGRRISHTTIMNDTVWPREELRPTIKTFREIVKHPSLRASFISSWWAPRKRLAWTDDAAWATFATNMATVAWLAKEGGLRGILVDAEDYPRSRQYTHLPGTDAAYDETARLARARGAQIFRAIFSEYPDVTFLSFWMLSLNSGYFKAANPIAAAKAHHDLWPWFVNGMLDVMPATAAFVDGNECAYHYRAAKGDFYRSAAQQHTAALGLIAPENRSKYRAHLRAGFGLYLDSYINPTNSPWYHGPVNGSRLAHFVQNLTQAADAADEYVWVYGEKRTWVPWKGVRRKNIETWGTWEKALPGFNDEMMGVNDPLGLVHRRRQLLEEAGAFTNLVAGLKRPWPVWQDEKMPRGKTGAAGEGVYLENVSSACHLVHICPVKPGESYGVRMRMKGVGGHSTVYWQKDGAWQWQLGGVVLAFEDGTANAWRIGEALVRVPDGADRLVLQLSAARQRAGERVEFDQVEIFRLAP